MSAVTDPLFEQRTFSPDRRSVFGPIVSAFEIEDAVAACVRKWIRDYLAETERQRGLKVGGLPWFRSIVAAGQAEKWPEDQLPALLIASPGLDVAGGRLEKRGDWATYAARWRIECTSEISARGNRQAIMLARLYTSAVRALVVQQTLDRVNPTPIELRRVEWVGERYDIRDWTVDRTRAAGTCQFIVEVFDVVRGAWGPVEPEFPPTPPTEPPPPILTPDVTRVDVQVTKREDEED